MDSQSQMSQVKTSCCGLGAFLAILKKSNKENGYSTTKNIKLFSYEELKHATKNFHAGSRIGRGGFGTVYKGTLKNKTQVAVKLLSAESKQGIQEFLTEIDTITNVKHPNLVELIGCCVQGDNRILVYEYVENRSLDRVLLGPTTNTINLEWSKRSAICIGTARGLAFLHEELDPHIVHRDIKASNILLDRNFIPKIGDFGLAKLFPDDVSHLSTRVAGTTGYLAPEYAMRGQLTKKADVYSFGVLILEIVSGRNNAKSSWSGMPKVLLEWVWELYQEGRLLELVDPQLQQYPEDQILRFIKVALFCTQAAAKQRPSMTQVVAMLTKKSRLHEKQLTPPGIMQDLVGITKSANYQQTPLVSSTKDSSAVSSSDPLLADSPVIVNEMIPR